MRPKLCSNLMLYNFWYFYERFLGVAQKYRSSYNVEFEHLAQVKPVDPVHTNYFVFKYIMNYWAQKSSISKINKTQLHNWTKKTNKISRKIDSKTRTSSSALEWCLYIDLRKW
jgi:hypothetical protein